MCVQGWGWVGLLGLRFLLASVCLCGWVGGRRLDRKVPPPATHPSLSSSSSCSLHFTTNFHTSRYPQIYESDEKLVVDAASVVVARRDFITALSAITPASHRQEWQGGRLRGRVSGGGKAGLAIHDHAGITTYSIWIPYTPAATFLAHPHTAHTHPTLIHLAGPLWHTHALCPSPWPRPPSLPPHSPATLLHSLRSAVAHARPLPLSVAPAMVPVLAQALARLKETFPAVNACLAAAAANAKGGQQPPLGGLGGLGGGGGVGGTATLDAAGVYDSEEEEEEEGEGGGEGSAGPTGRHNGGGGGGGPSSSSALLLCPSSWVQRPRLLLCGPEGAGQQHVGPALLYALEGLPVHAVGLPSLLSDPG